MFQYAQLAHRLAQFRSSAFKCEHVPFSALSAACRISATPPRLILQPCNPTLAATISQSTTHSFSLRQRMRLFSSSAILRLLSLSLAACSASTHRRDKASSAVSLIIRRCTSQRFACILYEAASMHAELPAASAHANQKSLSASKQSPSSRPGSAAATAPVVGGGGAHDAQAAPGSKTAVSTSVAAAAAASVPRPATAPLTKHAAPHAAASTVKPKPSASAAVPAKLVSAPAADPRATPVRVPVFQARAAAGGGGGLARSSPLAPAAPPLPRLHHHNDALVHRVGGGLLLHTRKPAAAVLPFNSSVPPKEPTKPSQPAAATAVALSHPVSTITVGAALPSASDLAVALELQQLQLSQLRAITALCSNAVAAASPHARKDAPQLQLARAILAVVQQ